MNDTKNEITELSSKCWFNKYYIYGAMLKNVFPFRLHVSSIYKCPFNTILSCVIDFSNFWIQQDQIITATHV